MESLIQNIKTQFYSYEQFVEKVEELASKGLVTGNSQSEAYLQTTIMNLHRIKRIQKKGVLVESLKNALKENSRKQIWYVFVEGWCADASQNIPFLHLFAEYSENIELKFLLRDENEELMNMYLTNGAKAIPKLVSFDAETKDELGVWGPRPANIQAMVFDFKKEYPKVGKADFLSNLQKWYAKDKGFSLQEEFVSLLNKWK